MRHFIKACMFAIFAPLATASVVIEGEGSTFIVDYNPIYDSAHQTVMNNAIQFWADAVVSPVPVRVDVRAENFSCSFAYSSHVDTQPPEAVINFDNAPLANTYYPIALANAFAGTDLNPGAHDIIVRYSRRMITHTLCKKWYLGYDMGLNFTQSSLYFETMQEIAHGLGLIPLGDLMTGEKLNGYNDIYWTQLKSTILDKPLTELSASQVDTTAHNTADLAFAGENTWAESEHLTFGRENGGLLTFARSYDAEQLTGFHLHDGTRPKQLMMVDVRDVIPETELAVTMLEDLGWKTTRNSPPEITGQRAISISEDSSYDLSIADLTVIDETPNSLTLSISSGSNYAFSGNRITPNSHYFGTLTVPVTVSDGDFTSAIFNVSITVNAVNDAPVITGQSTLTTFEDTPITLAASNFTVTDIDSSSFELTVLSGSNYSTSGNKITPAANYHGELTVPVRISDGIENSDTFNATVSISPVNDAPSVLSQSSLTTNEDQALTLNINQFTVADIDSSSFSLQVLAGTNYSVSGNTITPNSNFNGLLSVPVRVSDGALVSATFTAAVSVAAVNDAPVITNNDTVTFAEDTSFTFNTNHFEITDVDSSSFSLQLLAGSNYSLSGTTLVPDENYFGTLTASARVNDGATNSANYTFTVTVSAVNDAPNITAQSALATQEDMSLTLSVADFTIADVDSSSFTLSVLNGDNYQVSGTSITPDENFSGVLSVPVRVNDGDVNSALFNASVSVSSVNDAPVITGQASITTLEDTAVNLTTGHFTIEDADSTMFDLSIQSGANYQITGNTLTPSENYSGTLTVPVTVNDGYTNSSTFNATVLVTAVNDAPVLTGHIALTIDEDAERILSITDFEFTDVDSTGFELKVNSGDNYSVTGNTITPVPDFAGDLLVPVQISDFNANSNTLITRVTVTAVNDAPTIVSQNFLNTLEDTGIELTLENFVINDVDSNNFTLAVGIGSNYSVSGNHVLPTSNFNGELSVPVTINDGSLNSEVFTASIHVTPVNDAPVVTSQTSISIIEDSELTLVPELLNFTDVDSTAFTIAAITGSNYSVVANKLIPTQNFNGTLTVPMQISDSEAWSNTLMVSIDVTPVNDAPVLNPIALQEIHEDTSLFITEDVLDITDPDSTAFTVSIARGENYVVAGNEVIPYANWFGELYIEITVSDGELNSNTETLNLVVTSINDLPVITTDTLPTAQIYREWSTQLEATDIDGDSLGFTLMNAPSWIEVTETGELSAFPNENMIGEHELTLAVTDGFATTSSTLQLTVLDDPTATDTQVSLAVERPIWATNAWVPVNVTLTNNGPKTSVETAVSVNFSGEWTTQDARCSVVLNECYVTVAEQATLNISVQQASPGSNDLSLAISHSGFEVETDNNTAQLTLTFTDGTPTTPQYTVPSFGQGTVRAIALSNIQGGRWPEIMFANGPTEASTAYKFEKSLFRPVLHSHLADAADSYAMALFDIDNDGDKDWVLANGSSQPNTVYRNNGEGFFEYIGALGSYSSGAVAYGDLDQDGDLDLVFANDKDPNTLYLNQGDGSFELYKEFESRGSRRVLIHDFNRDGRPDIFFANRGFRHQLFINRGFAARSFFKARNGDETSVGFGAIEFGEPDDLANEATLADLDGDGIATDLVLANEANNGKPATLKVFSVDETGQSELITETETGSVTDLSVGDYDGDGKDDIAVLRPGGALEVMASNAGVLTTTEVMDTDGADTILMVDVDGGGQADIISANNRNDSSRLDFAGEVTNAEDALEENDSAAIPLQTKPGIVAVRPVVSEPGKKGGAGISVLALLILLTARRYRRKS